MICKLLIDGQPFQFEVEGNFNYGANEVLYKSHPILKECDWEEKGYKVIDLLNAQEYASFEKQALSIINRIIKNELDLERPRLKNLTDYHKVVEHNEDHFKVISKTRFLKSSDFSIDLNQISSKVSQVIGREVGIYNPKLEEEIIILRISRPNTLDINPLHRDGYLEIWENTINVWIPIAGCNHKSTLPIIPGSHLWNEQHVLRTAPKGAKINGLTYHVPGIIGGPYAELKSVRPNPGKGQALIFTPFIVHGSAINQNPDTTRMSLELRLCLQ